ncbi:MAG: folate-binding protein [Mariprofundaceae bacterium]
MSDSQLSIPAVSSAVVSNQTAEMLAHGHIFCREPLWAVIKASGEGVRDYLQGQITQDMSRLSAEQGIHACLLTPQGKAVCELYIIEGAGNELVILTPRFIAEQTVARLRRFALGYSLRIGIVDALTVWSVQGEKSAELFAHLDIPLPDNTWLASSRHAAKECLAMSISTASKCFWLISDADFAVPQQESEITASELEAIRIIRGRLRFGAEWDASIHPLNANLIEFNGVSFDKGCYVGQEVTSRMHWRGGIKKKLYRIQLNNAEKGFNPKLPCPIHSTAPVGELRALACDNTGTFYGIALLAIEVVQAETALKLTDGSTVSVVEACHA